MGRARDLLEEYVTTGKAMQLATLDADGAPMVCNLWYAYGFAPDRLWFISRPDRVHCENIRADGRVAGAVLAIELDEPSKPVRGVSFRGTATELGTTGIEADSAAYAGRWPSTANAIDPARLASGEAHHRIYRIEVTSWILYDEVNFKPPRTPVAVLSGDEVTLP